MLTIHHIQGGITSVQKCLPKNQRACITVSICHGNSEVKRVRNHPNFLMKNVKKKQTNVIVKPPNLTSSVLFVCFSNSPSTRPHRTDTHPHYTSFVHIGETPLVLPQIQIINITPCLTATHTHTHLRGSFKNREQVAMETTYKCE